jgi:hypothetical protein
MTEGRGMRPVALQMGVTLDGFVHGAKGLFGALREPLRLDLIEARTFPSGTAIYVAQPREGNR